MLHSSSLLAIVASPKALAGESQRRLQLWNTRTDSLIAELNFSAAILAVKMNRARLIAVLETRVHVFELATMKLLHTLETSPNRRGIAELSSDADVSICALPAKSVGNVLIFDALQLRQLANVKSRKSSPLSALALSSSGQLLATASDKGTVVRVHCLPLGQVVHSFRRGSLYATILSLSFSVHATPAEAASTASTPGPSFLCAAASSGTVHVWSIAAQRKVANVEGTPRFSVLSGERAFAHAHLGSQIGGCNVVAAVREGVAVEQGISQPAQLCLLTSAGTWYCYRLDMLSGGEAELIDERRVI